MDQFCKVVMPRWQDKEENFAVPWELVRSLKKVLVRRCLKRFAFPLLTKECQETDMIQRNDKSEGITMTIEGITFTVSMRPNIRLCCKRDKKKKNDNDKQQKYYRNHGTDHAPSVLLITAKRLCNL